MAWNTRRSQETVHTIRRPSPASPTTRTDASHTLDPETHGSESTRSAIALETSTRDVGRQRRHHGGELQGLPTSSKRTPRGFAGLEHNARYLHSRLRLEGHDGSPVQGMGPDTKGTKLIFYIPPFLSLAPASPPRTCSTHNPIQVKARGQQIDDRSMAPRLCVDRAECSEAHICTMQR